MKSKIALSCEKCKIKNYKTNKSIIERLELKKFCSRCKEHTIHKEEK
ncbi:RIBOSOMAL PROTEIN L33 [Mycoplasmopsis pulmonis]|uniref:Large ribosomal subunit protein bL33B n=1 Tax=Mycoplasmopsis pulmonis (strain UAB CTIP) TaxID=272635 RepID=RL332_MYCPU|nr:50S ribosomal protein L33 [Mycoplasmopsis pulmonis]Q98R30.1 RecName: Full=Large ribosomal subunit protein bL33B; AltName: Full=50S ribosomal protein L33 2 [Mycoplasmopsis pulmonis UAB CTIP]MDZ7293147.1 50S ribosomal protein L33 [Mycoplasmopsis pulmonis]CAC13353.1 RIBOSOMAL PROTEIN L33 [Mycoplasmopsis pulmonis]